MTDSNEWGIFTVHSQLETTQPSINVELQINNVGVVMELDTGASLTIMSEKIQQKIAKSRIAAIYSYTKNVLRRATESPGTGTSESDL